MTLASEEVLIAIQSRQKPFVAVRGPLIAGRDFRPHGRPSRERATRGRAMPRLVVTAGPAAERIVDVGPERIRGHPHWVGPTIKRVVTQSPDMVSRQSLSQRHATYADGAAAIINGAQTEIDSSSPAGMGALG
jgi:hypothetical protein